MGLNISSNTVNSTRPPPRADSRYLYVKAEGMLRRLILKMIAKIVSYFLKSAY
jgi:hypothetical protein